MKDHFPYAWHFFSSCTGTLCRRRGRESPEQSRGECRNTDTMGSSHSSFHPRI